MLQALDLLEELCALLTLAVLESVSRLHLAVGHQCVGAIFCRCPAYCNMMLVPSVQQWCLDVALNLRGNPML